MDPLVSGQGAIFRNRNLVMAMSQLMFARCATPSRPRFVAAGCSQCGAAEERLMTRLITPMTRAQVYGLLIMTAPGTRRCTVGE